MKKIFSFCVALFLVIAFIGNSTVAYALDSGCNNEERPILTEEYAILVENGIAYVITLEEAEALKSQENNIPVEVVPGGLARATEYKFTVSSRSTKFDRGLTKRVSPISGEGIISRGFSTTYEYSYTTENGVSLTPDMINTISLSASASVSAQTQTTFAASYTVPSGKYGAVFFTPNMVTAKGVLEVFKNWGYSRYADVTFTAPKEVDGYADGIYELKTASTPEGVERLAP